MSKSKLKKMEIIDNMEDERAQGCPDGKFEAVTGNNRTRIVFNFASKTDKHVHLWATLYMLITLQRNGNIYL